MAFLGAIVGRKSITARSFLKRAEHSLAYLKCPFFLIDFSNVKQWIFISLLLLIIYWMSIFSFFPTMMFLLKFIFLFLFINHSFGWAFSFVIFLVFIFQGFYIRSIGMILFLLCSALKSVVARSKARLTRFARIDVWSFLRALERRAFFI